MPQRVLPLQPFFVLLALIFFVPFVEIF